MFIANHFYSTTKLFILGLFCLTSVVIPKMSIAQTDTDSDEIFNPFDRDDDNDGIPDEEEYQDLCTDIPSLEIRNSTDEPGGGFRFSNVLPGVDMLVTEINNINTQVVSIDDDGSNINRWQPRLEPIAAGDFYVDYELDFVETNTIIPVALEALVLTAIDLDGTLAGVREQVGFRDQFTYLTESFTDLEHNLADGYDLFTGPAQNSIGILLTNTDILLSAGFFNKSKLQFRLGGTMGSVGNTREFSLSFLPCESQVYGNPVYSDLKTVLIADQDKDGLPNHLDGDADGDGIADIIEAGGTDTDSDGQVDYAIAGNPASMVDLDEDGWADIHDTEVTAIEITAAGDCSGMTSNYNHNVSFDVIQADANTDIDVNFCLTGDYGGLLSGEGITVTGEGNTALGFYTVLNSTVPLYLDCSQIPFCVNMTIAQNEWNNWNDDGQVDLVFTPNANVNNCTNYSCLETVNLSFTISGANGTALALTNSDNRGKSNFLDIDADDDGIVDNTEAQSSDAYIGIIGMDSDNDGIDDAYDVNCTPCGPVTGVPYAYINSDEIDTPDYIDTDADNDGVTDEIEGHDTNGDGTVDQFDATVANTGVRGGNTDIDKDGLLDGFDNNTSSTDPSNGGLQPNSHPNAKGGTDEPDWRDDGLTATVDTDEDGISDELDFDDDNDGILDVNEELCTTQAAFDWAEEAVNTTIPATYPTTVNDLTIALKFSGDGWGGDTPQNALGGNARLLRDDEDLIGTGFGDNFVLDVRSESDDTYEINSENNQLNTDLIFSKSVANLNLSVADVDFSDFIAVYAIDNAGNTVYPEFSTAVGFTPQWNVYQPAATDNPVAGRKTVVGDGNNSNTAASTVYIDFPNVYVKQIFIRTGYLDTDGFYDVPDTDGNPTGAGAQSNHFIQIGDVIFCRSTDTDADGIADAIDTDADADGCPDALEGGGDFESTDIQNGRLTGAIDGNGVPVVAGTDGQSVGNAQNPLIQECFCPFSLNIDTDGDGVDDLCDLDNDNDGILDIAEGRCDSDAGFDWDMQTVSTTVPADYVDTINNIVSTVTLSGDGWSAAAPAIAGGGIQRLMYDDDDVLGAGNGDDRVLEVASVEGAIYNPVTATNQLNTDLSFTQPVFNLRFSIGDLDFSDFAAIYGIDKDGNIVYPDFTPASQFAAEWNTFQPNTTANPVGDRKTMIGNGMNTNTAGSTVHVSFDNMWVSEVFIRSGYLDTDGLYDRPDQDANPIGGNGQARHYIIIGDFIFCASVDTDGDGVANALDTDSDGDGCPDAVESEGGFTLDDIMNDSLIGGVNINGIPLVASDAGQVVGQAVGSAMDSTQVGNSCLTTAKNDIHQASLNTAVSGNVLTNDSDPSGDAQMVQAATSFNINGDIKILTLDGSYADIFNRNGTLAGSFSILTDGSYNFIPASTFTGRVDVEYVVSDTNESTDVATLAMTVIAPDFPGQNDAPVANDDTNDTEQDKTISGNVITSSDSDPDGDALLVIEAEADISGQGVVDDALRIGVPTVIHGENLNGNSGNSSVAGLIELEEDGSYTFDPTLFFTGKISVNYTISDGNGGTADATLTIRTVADLGNETFANDDVQITSGAGMISGNIIDNDNDPESDIQMITSAVSDAGTALTVDGVSENLLPGNGRLIISSDGMYSYTAEAEYVGTEVIVFQICDDNTPTPACNFSTLYLNSLPIVAPYITVDDFNNTLFNTAVSGDVSANDICPDGVSPVCSLPVSNGGMNTAEGTVTINPDGSYNFVPATDFSGTTQFTYELCDGTLCTEGKVYLKVLPPLDPEVTVIIANPDIHAANAGQLLTGNVMANDLDPDDLNPSVTNTMTNATVEGIDEDGNIFSNAGTFSINADGAYTFLPSVDFNGEVTLNISVCNSAAPAICDEAPLVFSVAAAAGNTTYANDDAVLTDIGVSLSGNVSTNDADGEADVQVITALQLDTDGDGKTDTTGTIDTPVTIAGTDGSGNYVNNAGTLTLNSNGAYDFVPAPNFFGHILVVYTSCDTAAAIPACNNASLVIIVTNAKRDYGDGPADYPEAWHRSVSDADDNNELDGGTDVWLGFGTDFETAQPENGNGNTDDFDDAISFGEDPGQFPLAVQAGETYNVDLTVNSTQPDLVFYGMWIDWDADGIFEDFYTGSRVTASPAIATVPVTAPANAGSTPVNIRLRADDDPFAPGDFGGGRSNGEVEDFQALVVLPVKLTHFSAQEDGCHVHLNWNAAVEANFSHYDVEHSTDGQSFKSIETIPGTGGSSDQWYTFEDKEATQFNYYRLKMVDLDGSFDYSNVVNSNTECQHDYQVTVYPNPISNRMGALNVNFFPIKDEVTIRVVDMHSRIIKQFTTGVVKKTMNSVQIDISGLPSGTYSLQLIGGEEERSSSTFIITNE